MLSPVGLLSLVSLQQDVLSDPGRGLILVGLGSGGSGSGRGRTAGGGRVRDAAGLLAFGRVVGGLVHEPLEASPRRGRERVGAHLGEADKEEGNEVWVRPAVRRLQEA